MRKINNIINILISYDFWFITFCTGGILILAGLFKLNPYIVSGTLMVYIGLGITKFINYVSKKLKYIDDIKRKEKRNIKDTIIYILNSHGLRHFLPMSIVILGSLIRNPEIIVFAIIMYVVINYERIKDEIHKGNIICNKTLDNFLFIALAYILPFEIIGAINNMDVSDYIIKLIYLGCIVFITFLTIIIMSVLFYKAYFIDEMREDEHESNQ